MSSVNIFLLLLLLFQPPDENYKDIFEEHYVKAVAYLENIQEVSNNIFSQYNADSDVLRAVVFPELIRYSIIMDYLETASLELVYINTGEVDFSIGRFQMKPSFAENIENYFISDSAVFIDFQHPFRYVSDDIYQIRKERVERLKSVDKQLHYLGAFYKIMEYKYPQWESWDEDFRIRFISTAYNHNFEADEKQIRLFITRKFFPWGKNNRSVKYNYSSISLDYYKSLKQEF